MTHVNLIRLIRVQRKKNESEWNKRFSELKKKNKKETMP